MMKKEQKGYITLYLTLTLGVMLTFVFLLLEGVRSETIRTETETVLDIGLYSVFGEFNRQLLEQYDLFFVDTSYGQGKPDVRRSEEHLQYYMNENFQKQRQNGMLGITDVTNLTCDNVIFENYMYASDEDGEVLKNQIVDYMQDKVGISSLERILSDFEVIQKGNYLTMDISAAWEDADANLNSLLEKRKQELSDNEEEPIGLDNPADYVKGIRGQGILGLALSREKEVSAMTIHPEYYLSHRKNEKGMGSLKTEENLTDKITEGWLLREYFVEKCGSYHSSKEGSLLKYQLEYLLFGKESDLENLEAAVNRILYIREAINFVSLMADTQKVEEADALATLISLVCFSPEIKDAVKATILFAWSYAESVKDMRILLDGNKLPLLKTKESWNTPLSKLLLFTACLDEYRVEKEGFRYEDYLKFFLIQKPEKELLYRFMDLCEMDIRMTEGNEYFQMDGCISAVKAKVNVSSGYGNGYEIIGTYQY